MNLALLSSALIFIGLSAANGGRVAVTLLALHLHASPFIVGTLLAAFSALPALLAIPAGRVIDRIGVTIPVTTGLLMFAVALLLGAAWPVLPMLYVIALLIGTGSIGVSIALSNAVGMQSKPADRTRNFSIYTIGVSASNAAGPIIIGFAIDHLGFQNGFLLLTGLAAVSLVVFWMYRHTYRDTGTRVVTETRKQHSLQLLMDSKLRPVFIASTTVAMIWDVFGFIVPVWGTRLGLSASSIGLILGAFSASTFTIRLILPLLTARFSEWTLIAATIFSAAIGFAVIPFATSFGPLLATSMVLGAGFGFGYPMLLAVAFTASPKGREAEVAGMRYAVGATVHFLVPLALGAMTTALGIAGVAWASSSVMLGSSWNARRQARLHAQRKAAQAAGH
jgi:MFS family permease